MLGGLVATERIVSVGPANVEDGRNLLWIFAHQFVGVLLAAQPQVVDDVLHHEGLRSAERRFNSLPKTRVSYQGMALAMP